jgi:precorrin-6A/cobalt-precorrin-6A reductase
VLIVTISMQHRDEVRMLRVLVLGGTSEARSLAALLETDARVDVVSSLAGRVANPALPVGGVRIGGFGGADGLSHWLLAERIGAVVDATHPFAATITANALAACERTGVPLIGLRRPSWTESAGDRWRRVTSVRGAAMLLASTLSRDAEIRPSRRRVFLTTGRRDVGEFAALTDHWFLIRSVDPPAVTLPEHSEVLLARGPYTVAGETELMQRHRIDVLVTKDSGGELTRAKLVAARDLGVTVVMVDRPPYPLTELVSSAEAAAHWVSGRAKVVDQR